MTKDQLADLRRARQARDAAQTAFEQAVLDAYRSPEARAVRVAEAAGWSRPRLYQFLKHRGVTPRRAA